MNKKYIYIFALLLSLFSLSLSAQENKLSRSQETIEGLNFYPNPVNNGKIYISSKSSQDKEVTVYDVLGKPIFQAIISNKELNISSISSGVYIIKIREGEATATRKLIVR